jgi:hypothetical protein
VLQVLTYEDVVAIPAATKSGYQGVSSNGKAWQVRYRGDTYGTDKVHAPAPSNHCALRKALFPATLLLILTSSRARLQSSATCPRAGAARRRTDVGQDCLRG